MNEVLTQIAKQAQVEHCISHVRLQEFAELIVKECANICYNMETEHSDLCAYDILKHFGVEE
jgi:hypothetical protein